MRKNNFRNYGVNEVAGTVKVKGLVAPIVVIFALGFWTGAIAENAGRTLREREEQENGSEE